MTAPVRTGAAALVVAVTVLAGCGAPAAPVTQPPATATTGTTAPVSDTADFTDPERWATLPAFSRTEPAVLLTDADIRAAFPDDGAWRGADNPDLGLRWAETWCAQDGYQEPADDAPDDERYLPWSVPSGSPSAATFQLDALRWSPRGGEELVAAQVWGEAVTQDAAACPGATPLDPSALPGDLATLTARPSGDRWDVQATTTGGPTAVRARATVAGESAEDAGARVAALVATAVARLVAADEVERHWRDAPADRPDLSAAHLLTDDDMGDPALRVDPPPVATPAGEEAVRAGWCAASPPLEGPLPAQAWATSWAGTDSPERAYDVLAVEQRLLRFTGVGDEAGTTAAQAHVEALRAGAADCLAGVPPGTATSVSDQLGSIEGTEVLVTAVDQGDGTWSATSAARDGVTVLVVSITVEWEDPWYDDAVIATMTKAWSRVHAADRLGP